MGWLISLQRKLIKIGARTNTFHLAEVAVTGPMIRTILAAIHRYVHDRDPDPN